MKRQNQKINEIIDTVKSKIHEQFENVGKYVVAATGVALGFQKAFEEIKLKHPRTIIEKFAKGVKQLWDGAPRNAITKHYGKALLIGSAITTFLTWLIPTLGFKHNPNTIKTKVDTNKEYEVC